MILPSIDLAGGRVVQLRRGAEHAFTDPREPRTVARELSRFGTLAVVDLDAARGLGDNRAIAQAICREVPCRVGGGIRTADDVRAWIKAGAEQVMIGTAASPEFLRQFPREWLIACVDSRGSDVVVNGWTRATGHETVARAAALAPHCSGILFTQVQREGMLAGPDLDTARRLREAVDVPLTVAGGVRSIADLRDLLDLGASAQIGMALYLGQLDLTEAWCELVRFDRHELLPTVVVDADDGRVRMQAWSSRRSLELTLRTGAVWFQSRSRGLWEKGATSGHRQQLVGARWDCDRDCLLFRVRQQGTTCHRGTATCFDGDAHAVDACRELARTIDTRTSAAAGASYTRRLLEDPQLVAAKLREEVEEVIEAKDPGHIAWECADVVYHLLVRMRAAGVAWRDVAAELRSRQRGERASASGA
jgi:phosphoribosyl-ATP pyrophosphohydrolase